MTPAKSGSRRRVRRPVRDAVVGDNPEELREAYAPQDWSALSVGSAVEVIPPVGPSYRGRVDAKTPDSEIIWVVGLGGSGRRMVGNREGVRLSIRGG